MKGFLLDENLPAELAAFIGGSCTHVTDLGAQLTDDEVWEHAKRSTSVIVTKDSDFFDKLAMYGSPPQVVWIRTGNLRRSELTDLLRKLWPQILSLLGKADLVEVREERLEAIKF